MGIQKSWHVNQAFLVTGKTWATDAVDKMREIQLKNERNTVENERNTGTDTMTRTRYLFALDILAGAFPCNSKANVFIPWLTEKAFVCNRLLLYSICPTVHTSAKSTPQSVH